MRVNAKTQRVQCDGRALPANLAGLLQPDLELWLHNAAHIKPGDARTLAQLCTQSGARLHAIVHPAHVIRLNLPTWRQALRPDLLVLQQPTELDWPLLMTLVPRLAAMGLPWRLQVAIGRGNLDDLDGVRWQALAEAANLHGVVATVQPRLGPDAPPLRELAGRLAALALEPHELKVTRLVPSCAVPRGLEIEPVFASEANAAAVAYAPGCAACVHAARGHCPGIAADLLAQCAAPFGPASAGCCSADGAFASPIAAAAESVEAAALRLGLRPAWRLDQPIALAEELAAEAARWFPFGGQGMAAYLGMRFREHSSGWFDCTASDPDRQLVYFARDVRDAVRADCLERAMAERQAAAARAPQAGDDSATSEALDRQLGALFGYPACCIESVVQGHRQWREGQQASVAETAWFALTAARASPRWDWRLDPTTPLQDTVWIRHYPCRWDCADSLALVGKLAEHQPRRALQALAERPDATLLWADGTALPLRGVRVSDAELRDPQPLVPQDASQRAEKTRRAARALQPLISQAQALVAAHDLPGPGGVHVRDGAGGLLPLLWPDGGQHPDFPRLIVFSPDLPT